MNKVSQSLIVLAIAGGAFIAGRASSWTEPMALAEPPKDKKEAPKKPGMTQKEMMALAEPGEAHKQLNTLVGDWDGEVKIWFAPGRPPMTFKETVKRESLFDGRFVIEHVDAKSDMGPFKSLGIYGYNNSEKRYESFWIENGSTAMSISTGTFDADKKTFTFTGDELDMTGKKVKYKNVIDCANEDKQIKSGFKPGKDGKEFKAVEITLTRKT